MRIQFENVTKRYDDKLVLHHATLSFPPSGFVCITGPSGVGKTTIFQLLLGLTRPEEGVIRVLDEHPDAAAYPLLDFSVSVDSRGNLKSRNLRRQILPEGLFSVVFQEDRLLPWLSVLDNVLLTEKSSAAADAGSRSCRKRAIQILSELGLDNELSSMPGELSGGMARRVSIARSLAADARIYLMDEPTKGLDDTTRKAALETIHRYTDQDFDLSGNPRDKLLIMITHNPEETTGAHQISLPIMS